jgi:hypothetical protein
MNFTLKWSMTIHLEKFIFQQDFFWGKMGMFVGIRHSQTVWGVSRGHTDTSVQRQNYECHLFKSEIWLWPQCIVLSGNDLQQKQMSTECLSLYIYRICFFLHEISWVRSLFRCHQGQVPCLCIYQKVWLFFLYMKQRSLDFLRNKLNIE